MRDISCKLLSVSYKKDEIGRQKEIITEKEIPIIKNEYVGVNEFYVAREKGLKPELQLKISCLNYNDEEKLKYMNTVYSIIRTKEIAADEILLICERKEADE